MVHPTGIEPISLVPETNVLSVELRVLEIIIAYGLALITFRGCIYGLEVLDIGHVEVD